MQKYLLFCKCVVLLVSFEEIICAHLDFTIPEFSASDMYDIVMVEQDGDEQKFFFEKSNVNVADIAYTVLFTQIKLDTLVQEGNDMTVVSFETEGTRNENVNLKFKNVPDANYFVQYKTMPEGCEIVWGLIYSHWYHVYVVYDELENDLGFQLVDNPHNHEHVAGERYFFKRSYIENAVQYIESKKLLMRNKTYLEDYHITFQSENHRSQFLDLFPNNSNDTEGASYYYIPLQTL